MFHVELGNKDFPNLYWRIRAWDFTSNPERIAQWNKAYTITWETAHFPVHVAKAFIRLFRKKGFSRWAGRMVVKTPNGRIYGIRECNTSTLQMLMLTQMNIFGTAESIKDTSGTTHSSLAPALPSAVNFLAGTSTTAAAFTDYVLGAPTSGSSGTATCTINAYSGSSFTVTATITNSSGSSVSYAEIGIAVTVSGYIFLVTHDVGTAYPVSNGGTLNCTETGSYS